MKFSIITPCYNSEEYIEQCILSIKNQGYRDFEHIIVDGGSTDGTVDVIKRYENTYNMKWISEKDQGMYDAINKGFAMATGDIYSWINADDSYMPWTLQAVADCLNENPQVQWLTGIPTSLNAKGELYFRSGYRVKTYNRKCIARGEHHIRGKGAIQQESTFWTRQLWERVGKIDLKFKAAGDFDLWRRFAQYESLYTVETILAGFRIHEGQKSGDTIAYCKEFEECCTWKNFIWWAFNKVFHIERIYYYRNRNMLLRIPIAEDQAMRVASVKAYVKTFLLQKGRWR